MNTSRPLTLTIATVLLTLVSLFSLTVLLEPTRVPPLFVYTIPVVGVCGLIGAFGLWKMKRWGLLLSSILSALSILWNIPGLFIPRTLGGKAITMGYIVALGVGSAAGAVVRRPALRNLLCSSKEKKA